MRSIREYASTYGLDVALVSKFMALKPGEATRVINQLAGNGVATTKKELEKQLNIIRSEVKEGFDNLSNNTLSGLRDDAMDIVFTGYGLANRLGAPADLDYVDVVLSNLCKFDVSEEDALKTREKYQEIGVDTIYIRSQYAGYIFYVTKVAVDQVGSDNKVYPAGKWLKSFKWVDCRYQGNALSPMVEYPEFTAEHLTDDKKVQLSDVLAQISANYSDLTISQQLATELYRLTREAVEKQQASKEV